MSKPARLTKMGVRGRLLLAFLGISSFSLVAAASGFYSLSQVGGALNEITEQRVPEALSWLELSQRVERVVRAAPALLAVETETARAEVSNEITTQTEKLAPLLRSNRDYSTFTEKFAAEAVGGLDIDLTKNLLSLDELVKVRLVIVARRNKRIRELAQANSVAQRTLSPGVRILGTQMAEWHREGEIAGLSFKNSKQQYDLAQSIVTLVPQQKAAVQIDALHNNLLRTTTAHSAENIDVLIFPLQKSLKELSKISKSLPKRAKRRMEKQLTKFTSLTVGLKSLPELRKQELAVIAKAQELLKINIRTSVVLSRKITFLVDSSRKEMEEAGFQSVIVQALNRNILIAIVVLSLLSSFLIVWLYVGRSLTVRLTALSNSMLSIAAGNLHAPLPAPRGNDEITRMSEALTGFRDTAIEMKESNLRDIEEAQRRLVDAIENSSEGFAFYDPEDQLVICNNRYRELLYPNAKIRIEPGTKFENIIRRAAEEGFVAEAEGRIEEWIKERLARHSNPGDPRVQRRGDGKWILITERKTGDAGTVAIYSDITDLKQREEELTAKSNTLEQLSNQLAKYLSPQIYDSIFSGKKEVKLTSQRKRLTVFFSDLVGFTSTTERMESEDLTHLLNQYLTEMSQIALDHGATIDKYIGDAIVIFFGDPESLGIKEDAIACVSMAVAMRKRMTELEKIWKEAGIEEPLQCRMGINTGLCTVGNFGSEDRMDYTIIGSGVNLASRLETACVPNEILISYETYAHVRDVMHCKELEKIEVKGIAKPVSTYQIVDFHENLKDIRKPIRAKLPHFLLDVDVSSMSAGEQQEALTILIDSVEQLSNKHVSVIKELSH